jgi:asparagine synthase (glutamine-hydrolysing)
MCGLTGFVHDGRGAYDPGSVIERMTSCITHRGPDDAGAWRDDDAGVVLGHRRLSIIDLSPEGHQPMASASGRYLIAFNGEIYNFVAVRQELEREGGVRWRGHSDTEIMLAAFERWGLAGALQRFNGMFAFALWDRTERKLHLARDRAGEKPLYYGWVGGAFVFGSELKALRAFPGWEGEVDVEALALFMRHNYVPAPRSIYRGISKLPPGTVLTLPWAEPGARRPHTVEPYWSARQAAEAGLADPFRGTDAEAVEALDRLLTDAVGLRMMADVPLGAFLSGGVDSSTVVALMQKQSATPVRTFSIGFAEQGYDEAQYAREVAKHLGTRHTEHYVTPQQAMDVIPRLPEMYDEPFADSSQIPTYLVSELARRHVTVALSGDAGDELFAGYNRYFWNQRIWKHIGWMPHPVRTRLAGGMRALSADTWERLARPIHSLVPARLRVKRPGEKVHKLAAIVALRDEAAMYQSLVSHWELESGVVKGAGAAPTLLDRPGEWARVPDFTHSMLYLDFMTYLPDDILVKVDRASMAVSLEGRVPLLDHRLVEFAWRVPMSMKIRDGQGKWLLRQVLDRYVPRALIERPKMGFGVPVGSWLRGPLRDWAESLLDERRLREEGFLDAALVRGRWREHLAGTRDWEYHLWDVLMFQAWHESQALAPVG